MAVYKEQARKRNQLTHIAYRQVKDMHSVNGLCYYVPPGSAQAAAGDPLAVLLHCSGMWILHLHFAVLRMRITQNAGLLGIYIAHNIEADATCNLEYATAYGICGNESFKPSMLSSSFKKKKSTKSQDGGCRAGSSRWYFMQNDNYSTGLYIYKVTWHNQENCMRLVSGKPKARPPQQTCK
jgi:hypothetical protein